MVSFGAAAGRVSLRGAVGDTAFETDVRLSTRDARRATLNGELLSSAERLRTELRTLVFTPDRLAVVKGAPATRRAYLDRSLSRLLPARGALPVEYAAAVGQRNACLRRLRAGASSREALQPWTERVASLGVGLVDARLEAVALLAEPFARISGLLGLDDASIAYDDEPPTVAELDARLDRDIERGVTGLGPHLHDLGISAGARDLRFYGSQGEQRVAVLSLVLAEAEVIRERLGDAPLVLLDDVLSELDGSRRRVPRGDRLGRRPDGGDDDRDRSVPAGAGTGTRSVSGEGRVMERIERSIERELARGGGGGAHSLVAVTAAWSAVVGEHVARHAWPLRVGRDGTLHVATSSSTWAFELDRLAPEIVEKLGARLGSDAPPEAPLRGRPPAGADGFRAEQGARCGDARRAHRGRRRGGRRGGRDRRSRPPRACSPGRAGESLQASVRPPFLIDFLRPVLGLFAGLF